MRKEYDFSKARRGPVLPLQKGKTRITIRLDDELVDWFKRQVHAVGGGNYQTMINHVLRDFVADQKQPMEALLRRVVREELRRARPRRGRMSNREDPLQVSGDIVNTRPSGRKPR